MNYDELVRSVARAISNCYDKKSLRIDTIRELCLAKGLTKLHTNLALVTYIVIRLNKFTELRHGVWQSITFSKRS